MSEFILNTEGAGAPWYSLDAFTQGFIEAAFFCESSCYDAAEFFTDEAQEAVREGQADGSIPSDSSVSDIDRDSFCLIKDICDKFQTDNAALLQEAYACDYDEEQAGRDLYYTRAGHGVGYWSREELQAPSDADEYARLTAIMRAEGTTPDEWAALSSQIKALKSDIGERLSSAAGRGEINLDAYQDDAAGNGFLISFFIS